jgi:hypothetical protein
MEASSLRIKDLAVDWGEITIRSGMGGHDRIADPAGQLSHRLRLQADRARARHERMFALAGAGSFYKHVLDRAAGGPLDRTTRPRRPAYTPIWQEDITAAPAAWPHPLVSPNPARLAIFDSHYVRIGRSNCYLTVVPPRHMILRAQQDSMPVPGTVTAA